jgi:hypothetical protein
VGDRRDYAVGELGVADDLCSTRGFDHGFSARGGELSREGILEEFEAFFRGKCVCVFGAVPILVPTGTRLRDAPSDFGQGALTPLSTTAALTARHARLERFISPGPPVRLARRSVESGI